MIVSNKKLVLLGTVLFLSVLFLLPSVVVGYGTTSGTAEAKTIDTTYNEVLSSGDDNAWYKVYRASGSYLWAKMTWSSSLDGFTIWIYDPSASSGIGAGGVTSASIGKSIDTSGDWFIRVERDAGSGDVSFTLQIRSSSSGAIPGFEWLYAFFSIVVLLGIIAFYKSRKSILN